MTDEELIDRAVSDIRAACQQYCVADCDCSDFARELRSRWQSLTAAVEALRAIADPNKLDASRSPLPDNLARLALSWLAARPEFENAREVLKLYDRRAS